MDFVAARSNSAIIHAFPFNSEKKRGGVALKLVTHMSIWMVYFSYSVICFNLFNEIAGARTHTHICIFFTCKSNYNYSNFWQSNSEICVHWKGAAEIVLASCTSYIDADDNVVEMDEEKVCSKQQLFVFVFLVPSKW